VPCKHNGRLRADAAEELLGGRARASPLRCKELDERAVLYGILARGGGQQQEEKQT